MPVEVTCSECRAAEALAPLVGRWATRMLAALALPRAELSILLCDDATIHELNRTYRHIDRPTDVLAFAIREAGEPTVPSTMLGDVAISIDTAARQARALGRSVEDEVAMLLAHGVLHLLGHDHRDRTEERRMTARTDALRSVAIARRPATRSRGDRPKSTVRGRQRAK